jgi:hypothetical protein
MSADPNMLNGYVPWSVYVDDRRQSTDRLTRIEDKVDKILERQTALEVAAAHDDGSEVAQDAAERALDERKKSRAERWWDLGRTTFAAVLGVAGTLAAIWLGGSL